MKSLLIISSNKKDVAQRKKDKNKHKYRCLLPDAIVSLKTKASSIVFLQPVFETITHLKMQLLYSLAPEYMLQFSKFEVGEGKLLLEGSTRREEAEHLLLSLSNECNGLSLKKYIYDNTPQYFSTSYIAMVDTVSTLHILSCSQNVSLKPADLLTKNFMKFFRTMIDVRPLPPYQCEEISKYLYFPKIQTENSSEVHQDPK